MDLQLAGANVLITGAGQGVGRRVADAFVAEGANVVFAYHSSSDGGGFFRFSRKLRYELVRPAFAATSDCLSPASFLALRRTAAKSAMTGGILAGDSRVLTYR